MAVKLYLEFHEKQRSTAKLITHEKTIIIHHQQLLHITRITGAIYCEGKN